MASKGNKNTNIQTSDINQSALQALKSQLFGTPPPKGWYSISQIANLLGVNNDRAERLVTAQNFKMERFTTKTTDGKNVKIKHYHIPQL